MTEPEPICLAVLEFELRDPGDEANSELLSYTLALLLHANLINFETSSSYSHMASPSAKLFFIVFKHQGLGGTFSLKSLQSPNA